MRRIMTKYHINPETGNAGVCKAKNNCPLGGDELHGSTAEDARKIYEAYVANDTDPQTNAFSSFKKNKNPVAQINKSNRPPVDTKSPTIRVQRSDNPDGTSRFEDVPNPNYNRTDGRVALIPDFDFSDDPQPVGTAEYLRAREKVKTLTSEAEMSLPHKFRGSGKAGDRVHAITRLRIFGELIEAQETELKAFSKVRTDSDKDTALFDQKVWKLREAEAHMAQARLDEKNLHRLPFGKAELEEDAKKTKQEQKNARQRYELSDALAKGDQQKARDMTSFMRGDSSPTGTAWDNDSLHQLDPNKRS